MRYGRAAWLPWCVLLVFACGGRFQQTAGGDDDDTGGTSGSQGGSGNDNSGGTGTNRAGSASAAGSISAGGATAAGGAISVGGSTAAGGVCGCPAIACASGYKPVLNPDGCCFHCEPLGPSCDVQHQNYATFREQLLDKYSTLGCMSDMDCTTYYDKTQCGASCGTPLPIAALKEVDAALNSFAQMTCTGNCPPLPIPACAPSPAPACVMSRCLNVLR